MILIEQMTNGLVKTSIAYEALSTDTIKSLQTLKAQAMMDFELALSQMGGKYSGLQVRGED